MDSQVQGWTTSAILSAEFPSLVRESGFPGWWALLPVCGASLLIVGGPPAWINRRILSNRVAVFVGLISYPLYLWHWPILSFAGIIRRDDFSRGERIAAVCLSFLLAWATWRFVESPIRFGRKSWIKTPALAAISVMIAISAMRRLVMQCATEVFSMKMTTIFRPKDQPIWARSS